MVRRFSLKWAIVALVLCLAVGSATGFAAGPKRGGVIDVAISSWYQTLDPMVSTSGHDRHLLYNLYNTLLAINENFELIPELAESWTVIDEETIEFSLRRGVTFHDGTPFDAEAVKFNLERMMHDPISARKTELQAIDTVEAIDSHTVRLNLKYPDAGLLYALADRAGMMVSPAAVQAHSGPRGLTNEPVGTGPFKLDGILLDDHVRLVRFEGYWEEGLPYLDGVRFRPVLEEPAKVIGLRAGELHIIDTVPPRDVNAVRRDSRLRYYEVDGTGTNQVLFNLRVEPFDNKLVRQALNYAIDRQAMVQALLFGHGTPARGPFAPSRGYAYHPDLEGYEYNPQKARELLAEAGYPDGFTMVLDVINRSADRQWGEALQGFWSEIGVTVELRPTEQTTLQDRWLNQPDHPTNIRSWGAGTLNPDLDLIRTFHSEGWWNWGGYKNEQVDELIAQIRRTYDEAERHRLYRAVQELVVDDAPNINLFHQTVRYATAGNVQGFVPMADWAIRLKGVWLE